MIAEVLYILMLFGTPPSCDGKGICEMRVIEENVKQECQMCVPARIGPYEKGVMIAIKQADINDEVFLRFFTGAYFELPYDYELSAEMAKRLGFTNGLTLPAGKYKFNESDSEILLIFK